MDISTRETFKLYRDSIYKRIGTLKFSGKLEKTEDQLLKETITLLEAICFIIDYLALEKEETETQDQEKEIHKDENDKFTFDKVDFDGFKKELEQLINSYSIENSCNTPDFILTEFIMFSLTGFISSVNNRDKWYSFNPWEAKTNLGKYRKE